MILLQAQAAVVDGLARGPYSDMARVIGSHTLSYFLPEVILIVVILLLLLVDAVDRFRSPRNLMWVALLGLLAPAALILSAWGPEVFIFPDWSGLHQYTHDGAAVTAAMSDGSMLVFDGFANFFKVFVLVGGILTLGMIKMSRDGRSTINRLPEKSMGEMLTLLLGSVLGMMLLASATNLLMAYLSIELMSLASFILVAFRRRDKKGTEAALKYMLFGAVASGIMIYGISLLYGMTGTLNFALCGERLAQVKDPLAISLSMLMITVGFGYKMSIVPMHFWAPDAFEGAPTPVAAFLSVASKAAGFAVFMRFLVAMVGHSTAGGELPVIDWVTFTAVLAGITMTVGNITALWQRNAKRLLAYSSVAHAGYLMIGAVAIAAGSELGGPEGRAIVSVATAATAYYFVAYCIMNFGAFSVVMAVSNETGSDDVDAFNGLGRRRLALAVTMSVLLLSLLGVPPTFGFLGKMQIFLAGLQAASANYPIITVLLVVAVVNIAVSAFYYFRFIKAMFLLRSDDESDPLLVGPTGWALTGGAAILTVVLFIAGAFFMEPAQKATIKDRDFSAPNERLQGQAP